MSTSTFVESTSLNFRDDRSDKVYHVTIERCDEGFTVNCSWGRRGSALQSSTLTKDPVSKSKACSIYDKKIDEKRAKGYQLSYENNATTIPVANTTNPLNPQCNLLNPIEDNQLGSLMIDDQWVMQEKMDGVRLLIKRNGSEFTGYSRTGREASIPENVVEALRLSINSNFIIDGELVGDVYYAFDVLETTLSWRDMYYHSRRTQLETMLGFDTNTSVRCVKNIVGKTNKYKEFHRIREEGGEGVVFKNTSGLYRVGRPASGGHYLKYKFYKTCSALVTKINDKRSVGLSCIDSFGKGISIGNCTIPVNYSIPEVGSVVEVKYLYARLPSHALFQPSYMGVRLDIETRECVLRQLKYKTGERDQDDEG